MLRYNSKKWREFRCNIIEADGGQCVRCGALATASVMHVHHKYYISGLKPWEYPAEACETLCVGCHAKEHGKIRPDSGWVLEYTDDLGSLDGRCEYCGTEIRYVFFISHEKWTSMEVGEYCCDTLTATDTASEFRNSVRQKDARRRNFLNSPRWEVVENGSSKIIQNGLSVLIFKNGDAVNISVDGVLGKGRFVDINSAKIHLFEIIENGSLCKFMSSQKVRRSVIRSG